MGDDICQCHTKVVYKSSLGLIDYLHLLEFIPTVVPICFLILFDNLFIWWSNFYIWNSLMLHTTTIRIQAFNSLQVITSFGSVYGANEWAWVQCRSCLEKAWLYSLTVFCICGYLDLSEINQKLTNIKLLFYVRH